MSLLLKLLVICSLMAFSGLAVSDQHQQDDPQRAAEPEKAQRIEGTQAAQEQQAQIPENLGVAAAVGSVPLVTVLPFDYSPRGSTSFNLNWPGPPRRAITWDDVKLYKPELTLARPAPTDITWVVMVKEDISFWFDKTLGQVYITVREGQTSPSDSDIVGPTATGDGRAPSGAPTEVTGGFYLGCTKKGKVKGSENKNGNHADVYLELPTVASPTGYRWEAEKMQSPRHSITCD